MDNEIELKLLLPPTAELQPIIDTLAELSHGQVPSSSRLYNAYFDTADGQLQAMGMGFRVRSDGKHIEQTLKTKGKTEGGLHQRPEFNLPLASLEPDLNKFDQVPWPKDVQVASLNAQLQEVFTTHFLRHKVEMGNGDASIEVVLDDGEVRAGKYAEAIFEMELELKRGSIGELFQIADKMVARHGLRLGNLSKAARGYHLAGQRSVKPLQQLTVLPLNPSMSVEDAFVQSCSALMEFWQQQEEAYCQSEKNKYLAGIQQGISAMCQLLSLYRHELDCDAWQTLHQKCQQLGQAWQWVTDFTHLRELKSSKGPYRKLLSKSDDFLSYLSGRIDGILAHQQPLQAIFDPLYTSTKLGILSLMTLKPWRTNTSGAAKTLGNIAPNWLTQGWQDVKSQLGAKSADEFSDYVACEPHLRQSLYIGLLLSGIFDEEVRSKFRGPWLDLLGGMEELVVLNLLMQELAKADLADSEEQQDIRAWCQRKQEQYLPVMAQSRDIAVTLKPYW